MPTLVTGMRQTPDRRIPNVTRLAMSRVSARGFSLIELLVAVFVIVLLTGVVSLNVGRGGADLALEAEVRHISGLLSYASAEAALSASDHGLYIGENSEVSAAAYEGVWLKRFDQGWVSPRQGAEIFAPLALGDGYELRLILEGQPEADLSPYERDLKLSPQIVTWAGGEVTPGALEWLDTRTGELLYRLEWDLLGRMTLMPKGLADDGD